MKKNFGSHFYKKILDEINANIYITDVETDEIVYMNNFMKKTFGLEHPEGRICWQVLQSGMTRRCDFCKIRHLSQKKEGDSCIWTEENTVTGKTYLNYDYLETVNGHSYHIQNSVDISEQLQLSREASIDELTGILNRNAGKKCLEGLLKKTEEYGKCTVVLCDINGLKWVNDTYGHQEGDRLLVFFVRNMEEELQGEDFIFRLSGDEFVIGFSEKDVAEAEAWMKNMTAKLKERCAAEGIPYEISFSYGFAPVHKSQGLPVGDVLSIADSKMYVQKRNYHTAKNQKRSSDMEDDVFQYNKDSLFEVLSEGMDDYAFAGNLKTGKFLYSYKMVMDFGLPGQIVDNAAAFWSKKVHPEDVGMFLKSNQDIAEGRQERHAIVYRAQNTKGEWIHLLCRGKMIRDSKGQPDLFAGIIRNLDSKVASDNEELQVISESSTDGIFKASMSDGFPLLYANDGYYEIHGYTRTQLATELSNQADKLVYEDDRDRIRQEIADRLQEQRQRIVLEYRIRKRDGSIAWLHVNAGIIPVHGQPAVMVGMVMDITERRQLEQRLMRTEALFNVARKHSRLSMWEFDIRRKQIIQTEESREVHGFEGVVENVPESLIECGHVHPDSVDTIRKLYQDLEAGKPVVSAVIHTRSANQEETYWWEKVTYTGVQTSDGKAVWAIGFSEDITAQREAEIRVFKEETMSELLTEGLYFSFRINMTRSCVEELWNHMEEKPETDFSAAGYGEIFDRVLKSIANDDDRKLFQTRYHPDKISEYIEEKREIPDFEFRRKQKNGQIVWVALNFRLMISPENGDRILFGYLKNIDALKKRELSLQKRAELDDLTGLYNFSTAKLLIEDSLKKYGPHNTKGALLLLNIDDFKKINRQGGFHYGDKFLRVFSSELSNSLPGSCIKARVNWDLFLVFCSEPPKDKTLHEMAVEVHKHLSRTYQVDDREFTVTISVGMTEQFTREMSFDQMYQYARHALNAAKRNGKNQLLRYRDVETMVTGLDIRITIDARDYSILDLNTTGQIAFGVKEAGISGCKCYELLHERTTPCPFCHNKFKNGQKHTWECFVPPLNRVMHVNEKLMLADKKNIRKIHLTEECFPNRPSLEKQDIFHVLEESWKDIEKGVNRTKVLGALLHYIGDMFLAGHVLMYEREQDKTGLLLKQTWKVKGVSEETDCLPSGDALEKLFQKAFPGNRLFIEDENSEDYVSVQKFYGKNPVPLPVLLTGVYDNNRLLSVLVLERVKKNKMALNALALVAAFIRRTYRIYELNNNYEYALQRDQRTGLLNYHSYMQYLQNTNNEVYSAFGIAEAYIVDLKAYNEKYGITRGDCLLSAISEAITDIFGAELAFRISGAHFRILCPDMTYENFSHRCRLLEEWTSRNYPGVFITGKVWEQSAISVERLQQQVEERIAIARAKIQNENIDGSRQTITEMYQGLKESIDNGEFCTFLQPKACVDTGEICGAEALIRYRSQDKGIIPPARFLPAIEKAGLVRYIDLFVLKDVCRIIKEWMDKGWKPFPISLNYSRATFLEAGILDETNRIVESSGVPKELIEIEVTETIGSIDTVGLQNIVEQFSDAGYKISMDDFGAEYSNIHVLYSLRLNSLKLDRRIISDIYHNTRAQIIVESIINICKKLNVICVAEGVETEAHLNVLRDISCDMIQGYYLNKPLSEADFKAQYNIP